jgi:group I intron endonuclease
MEKIGYIYKITNPSGCIYIGKTIRLKDRISKYKYCSGIEKQRIIYNSIKKYGWEYHIFEIIEETKDLNKLSDLEIFYINKFNSYSHANEKGMNLTLGGDGTIGRIESEEVKIKRANSNRGGKRTEKTKYLMSITKKGKPSNRIGYICSEEIKQKVSTANKVRIQTPETIKKRKDSCLKKMIEEHECIFK